MSVRYTSTTRSVKDEPTPQNRSAVAPARSPQRERSGPNTPHRTAALLGSAVIALKEDCVVSTSTVHAARNERVFPFRHYDLLA